MSELPKSVKKSKLWALVEQDSSLAAAILDLREKSEIVGEAVGRVMAEYTDHSVKHMDQLWSVFEQIFTPEEIAKCSAGEAFVLGAAFYVHDLAMAFAASENGIEIIKRSDEYRTFYNQSKAIGSLDEKDTEIASVRLAARAIHGKEAGKVLETKFPGMDEFLIASPQIRMDWATHIQKVAESHHWDIDEVAQELGSVGKVPVAVEGEVDLAFVACALRLTDYAHINSTRAHPLVRRMRGFVPNDSLVHWLAQENISGPTRQDNLLKYSSNRPTQNVDAWWLFYYMTLGLDREIREVKRLLDERTISHDRISLQGVVGAESPIHFGMTVVPEKFMPVDVRFRPDNLGELVSLLGGRALYGGDEFAPIRELIQNAVDAIHLQRALDKSSGYPHIPDKISVEFDTNNDSSQLTVRDTGIGMDKHVIIENLLGVANSYWRSGRYFAESNDLKNDEFTHVGRFGIGFLSVFMLGDRVEVDTQRRGKQCYQLRLQGVGRRGELETRTNERIGTEVRVNVDGEHAYKFEALDRIVRAKVPMSDIPIEVKAHTTSTMVEPGWWKSCSQEELVGFATDWAITSTTPARDAREAGATGNMPGMRRLSERRFGWFNYGKLSLLELNHFDRWIEKEPEITTNDFRIIANPILSGIVVCSGGLAVENVRIPGMIGLVDVGTTELNTARSSLLNWNVEQFQEQMITRLKPHLLAGLDRLETEGRIPERFGFIAQVGNHYGTALLSETSLPWITVIEPPGHARLINGADLKSRSGQVDEVLIGYGISPWSIEKVIREQFPEAKTNPLIVAVNSTGQRDPGPYEAGSTDLFRGRLSDHFREEAPPVLLRTVLEVISSGWSIATAELEQAEWCRRQTNWVCTRLVKDRN